MVLGRYLPFKNAGIENYTHFLAKMLLQSNHNVHVAILNSKNREPYIYDGIQVIPLSNGFDSFISLLEQNHYDICHFQEYSAFGGIELFWFTAAKQYCQKIFFTFHLPYFTCYKNDFRYKGIEDCDNFSSTERCVTCIIATKMNYKKSPRFALGNFGIDIIAPLIKRSGKIHALQNRITLQKTQLNELINTCDHVFVYATWFKRLLNENGYQAPSIKQIPYITSESIREDMLLNTECSKLNNKILFVGRIEKQKGLLLICKAMNLLSAENIQLDVFGNIVDEDYERDCENEYQYNFKGTIPLEELLQILPMYDFLILPSVFTEMYSMMIKDAFQNQLPVIASAAKGNVDVIKEGKNGFTFNYNDAKDLARVIDKAYSLKQNGWKPEFELNNNPKNDLNEILHYYS